MNEETIISPTHPSQLLAAFYRALLKFNPFVLYRNPVIFITEIGAILTTIDAFFFHYHGVAFPTHVALCLWIIVLVANMAESLAEINNESKAVPLRKARSDILSNRYDEEGNLNVVSFKELRKGDLILVRKGETIPADGEIISGFATIDESMVTGASQPFLRRAQSHSQNVLAGSHVLTDQIVVRVTANPGEGFLDQMINLVEGSSSKKTHNELALTILLSSLSLIFLLVVSTFQMFGHFYSVNFSITMQIALFVCLIPTTISGFLNAIRIAGISRLMKKRVIALTGQSIEVAGSIDLILIDKTGTITYGNRKAIHFMPAVGIPEEEFARACFLTSFRDDTKEGQSITELLKTKFPFVCLVPRVQFDFYPFDMVSRLSGIDIGEDKFRKGSLDAIENFTGRKTPNDLFRSIKEISEQGHTPLVVADQNRILGVITLQDQIKPGIDKQFAAFKQLGIKTVLITGDNPITADVIAKEVNADEILASATPEQKMHFLKQKQLEGHIVAMSGDGINDAPALAQADLGLAMNDGDLTAKEAADMIDLDSHPNKLFEIIEVGKQMLMTRGAMTAFSIANDLAKYFIMIPAVLITVFPRFVKFNFLHLYSPKSAVLSTVIFNALVLITLIPLAFKGVKLIPHQTSFILKRNTLVYGLGGLILPFIGIKCIDLLISQWGYA